MITDKTLVTFFEMISQQKKQIYEKMKEGRERGKERENGRRMRECVKVRPNMSINTHICK